MPCKECLDGNHEDFWELYGCGWKPEYAGKGEAVRSRGATEAPYNRTCENYYWEQVAVQIVLSDLEDYRRGALGNVWDLPAAHLALLRVADAEDAQFTAYCQARIAEED